MPAKVRVVPSPGAESFEIPILNTATIGRTSDNTIPLPSSPLVSRQHAIIRCQSGFQYQLIDLGSRNGTYIDDQRVALPVTLRHGSRIRIGDSQLVFELEDETGSDSGGEILDVTLAGSMTSESQRVRTVSILVCDIRGFTTQSELLPPDALARVLGQWFREAGNIIQKHGGVIDKFIGDAILAFWPSESEATISKACEIGYDAARELMSVSQAMTWPDAEAKPFRVGIAMHCGTVTMGNVGLIALRDATIIGNVVNTAFRLESVMKEVDCDILLSEAIVRTLPNPEQFEDLGEKRLKGKSETVRVFRPKPSA